MKAFIIDEICKGLDMVRIVDENDRETVPAYSTIMIWLNEDKAFSESYVRAHEIRAHRLLSETLSIADDDSHDLTVTDRGIGFNKEFAARSRIRIDTRFRYLEKTMPKKYGVKIDHTTDGEKINQTIKVGYGKKDLDSYEDLL